MTGEILMAHKNFEDFKEAVTEHYNNIEFPAGAIGELSETIVNMSSSTMTSQFSLTWSAVFSSN